MTDYIITNMSTSRLHLYVCIISSINITITAPNDKYHHHYHLLHRRQHLNHSLYDYFTTVARHTLKPHTLIRIGIHSQTPTQTSP